MNDNLTAMATTSFIGGDATAETATATTTPTILPDFFRVPIALREVSEHSYIPKFCPLGLYSHATTMTNSSIHIKFREDFAKIFMDNTRMNWADICSHVVGSSVEYWVKLYGDFPLGQQGEGQPADAPQCQNVDMEEMKVLLVLDTVFVVCFLQGDHQRVCKASSRGLRCAAVSSFNQEMKKEALFPLVHLIRLDLFKFENQIPLGLIKKAFEMIVFEESDSSTDPFKTFLEHAVDLMYCLSRPREEDEFKGVLKTRDFKNCKHLLQCLYAVLCHESEFSKKRNLAIATENREQDLAKANLDAERATKYRERVERDTERADLDAERATKYRERVERDAERADLDAARAAEDRARDNLDAARAAQSRGWANRIAQILNPSQKWHTSTFLGSRARANLDAARAAEDRARIERDAARDNLDAARAAEDRARNDRDAARDNLDAARAAENRERIERDAPRAGQNRGWFDPIAPIRNLSQRWLISTSNVGNASSRLNRGGSSDQEIAPSGEATARGYGDTVHTIDVETGNSGNNQDHSIVGRADDEIEPETGTNTPAGSVADSEHGVSQEQNASSRLNGGGENRGEEAPAGPPTTSISVRGDGPAAANAPGNASHTSAGGWWSCFSSYLSKVSEALHLAWLIHKMQDFWVADSEHGVSQEENASSRLNRGGENRGEEVPAGPPTTSLSVRGDGPAAANAPGNASHTSACGWWPCFSSCLCKRRHKEHLCASHIPTISELQKVGIRVMVGRGKCATNWISEVNFKRHVSACCGGTLYLPEFSVYDETETLLRNLLAYEYVVEKKKDLISYINLMDNLIDTEEDVKLMRESLVLKNNSLGSDKLLADMWNRMLIGTVVELNEPYMEVFGQISSQYENGWNRFFAEFYGLYLRRPWLFFGAAGLVLTAFGSILGVVFTVLKYFHGNK